MEKLGSTDGDKNSGAFSCFGSVTLGRKQEDTTHNEYTRIELNFKGPWCIELSRHTSLTK